MKLNWTKIALIVLCAEILLIYWNGMSAIPFKKQQIVHPISTPQPAPPLTQIETPVPWQITVPISMQKGPSIPLLNKWEKVLF